MIGLLKGQLWLGPTACQRTSPVRFLYGCPVGESTDYSRSTLTEDDRAYIRDHRDALIAEVNRRRRRDELLSMLVHNPGRYAYVVDDARTDPLVVAIGIRDFCTFEMTIPAQRYDPWRLQQFLAAIDGDQQDVT